MSEMPSYGDMRPIPDPTVLTTQQLLREMAALREIIFTRLDAMDKATALLADTVNRTPTVIQSAVVSVRDIYDERFNSTQRQFNERDIRFSLGDTARDAALAAALSAAKEAVAEQAQAASTATDKAQESFRTIITGLRDIYDERFSSIQQQFIERDVRTEQSAIAAASALAAALQAAKEAVFEQAQAAGKAAEKTELSFTKQIDQIQLQIKTISDGFNDKIDDLKGRIDRGEGSSSGSASTRTERRLDTGQIIAGVMMIVVIISLLVAVFRK